MATVGLSRTVIDNGELGWSAIAQRRCYVPGDRNPTWDRFYESPFWPKTILTNFYPNNVGQIFIPKQHQNKTFMYICRTKFLGFMSSKGQEIRYL
jgi:hypothetical protein